jgi:hypothetical protein
MMISSLKLTADRTSRIVELFVNCVKRNLLMHNMLSKSVIPQPHDEPAGVLAVGIATPGGFGNLDSPDPFAKAC